MSLENVVWRPGEYELPAEWHAERAPFEKQRLVASQAMHVGRNRAEGGRGGPRPEVEGTGRVGTGGTGMLGSHAVRVLEERGHDLRAASRRTATDLATGEGLREARRGAELVLHAASDRRR
jgi:hypothetical protein